MQGHIEALTDLPTKALYLMGYSWIGRLKDEYRERQSWNFKSGWHLLQPQLPFC